MNNDSLAKVVSEQLIGKPYVLKGAEDNVSEFSCWSAVWHYERLSGLLLPYDPWEAELQFVEVHDCPKWRDILTFKAVREPVPHLGAAESRWSVVHSCSLFGSVERSDANYAPWVNARVMRHKSLL